MSGSALVRRFLGAFRRKAPPVFAGGVADPRPSALTADTEGPRAPLHPLATTAPGEGGDPIVVGPSFAAGSTADTADDEPPPPSPAVVDFVNDIRQLPLFSTTAMQLMQTVDDDQVAPEKIARMISADAGLVAQILRIVNSPYYGLPKRCSTMTTAIVVLGLDRLRRTVLAAVTHRPLLAYLHDTQAVLTFWRHQLLCAALARHLAVREGLDGEMAYTAGLMHEVGRLAILIRHPDLTEVLLDDVEADDDDGGGETSSHRSLRHERIRFGFDHAEVGGALLDRWGLPPAIVRATREHERVTQPADPFSAVVWHANRVAHEMAGEVDLADDAEPSPWMLGIGLSLAERRHILDEIAALEVGAD